ncbi:hypothetical protein Nepgr_005120 [Nepenthes gracilis]|uniref:Kinesin motor domain-containing protein n=1 Tax=Nepenthes gracilis TaxID=150966 RepID=A0AAD3S2R0_NEPGR|nr:hypothetical protein Nepgr_005120 [Nepenthes gracilis]
MQKVPMEFSPLPRPNTVTVRRNPHRRARATPSTNAALPSSPCPLKLKDVPNFPLEDILSMEIDQNQTTKSSRHSNHIESESLKVFLRIRPLSVNQYSQRQTKGSLTSKSSRAKNVWPKPSSGKEGAKENARLKSECKSCIVINGLHSVTVLPPSVLNRSKSEIYNGFSHVFSATSSQERTLGCLGPSGSGKTYTIFGTCREPGMVPRAIRHIFESYAEHHPRRVRSFYLSMFEIYSEKGKVEKLSDLSPEGSDLYMQQSVVKGLKEVLITDAAQAESLIARGMIKRATAMTDSNSRSSRSQCIINIRSVTNAIDGDVDSQLNGAVLTFVDLAGSEREKKTGSQGERLLEGNFINNTSMVFGLCLRSLLEYQKNPKKPMQKHFQSSLLTRYLRDYLEGKKRMALILTVRSGEKDYLDTSFLLRQASPFMEIKFHNMETISTLPHIKRRYQVVSNAEETKRMKLRGPDTYMDDERKSVRDSDDICKEEIIPYHLKKLSPLKVSVQSQNNPIPGVNSGEFHKADCTDAKCERDYHIMQGFAKAIWNVLKEYKEKLKVVEKEVEMLTGGLLNERTRYMALQREFNDLKYQCSCCKAVTADAAPVEEEICSDSKGNNPLLACLHSQRKIISSEQDEQTISQHQDANDVAFCKSTNGLTSIPKNGNFDALPASLAQADDMLSLNFEINKESSDQYLYEECRSCHDVHTDAFCEVKELKEEDYYLGKKLIDPAMGSSQSHVMVKSGDVHELHHEDEKQNATFAEESKLSLHPEKPKRRLMPASSVLLRDVNSLDFGEEKEKPAGSQGGRKSAKEDENKRTVGSNTLLRLLKSSIFR